MRSFSQQLAGSRVEDIARGDRESRAMSMLKKFARIFWLQNNNNMPPRQPNQQRPGSGPNGPMPPGRSPSSLNRWLLLIVMLMLAILAYSYFSQSSNSNASQIDQLTYSQFYQQINDGNVKTATFNGTNDISGNFKDAIGQYTQYDVIQLPNGDPNLLPLLEKQGVTVSSQSPVDNSFWLNILITV